MTTNTLKISEMQQSALANGDNLAGIRAGENYQLTENNESGYTPMPLQVVTALTFQMASNNGYVANNVSPIQFTLPLTFAVGDEIAVSNVNGGFTILQNAGQNIIFGNKLTGVGVVGHISSTAVGDQILLKGIVANTTLQVWGAPQGNLTYV